MSIPSIALDESGNSGWNLLDASQPVFVLASVRLSKTDAKSVLRPLPARSEAKFAKLRRSREGREGILNLLNSSSLNENTLLASALHKPYMVVAKMVDLLVEPLYYSSGENLYEQGQNLALANLLYYVMKSTFGEADFRRLCNLFIQMVRSPNQESIAGFYDFLGRLEKSLPKDQFREDIAALRATRIVTDAQIEDWSASSLDPAIPAFAQICSLWTMKLGKKFHIIHDDSLAIEKYQDVLEAIMSTTEKGVLVGYDRRKSVYPIKAPGIRFKNSSNDVRIQVADVVAGSIAYCLKKLASGEEDEFSAEIISTKALDVGVQRVWPNPLVTPEDLGTEEVGGIDPNAFLGNYIERVDWQRRG